MADKLNLPADIAALREIMARLRDPASGCPWDLEQDFRSIAPYTLEEAYEVVDAIERNDPAELQDELGDLLFQVVFHAQMASERGWFNLDDVIGSICEKMLRRHPHVFADEQVEDAEAQTRAWELHKARERGEQDSALDGVPAALPALTRAYKLQQRASRVGFDWPSIHGVSDKVEEELGDGNAEPPSAEDHDLLADLLAQHVRRVEGDQVGFVADLHRGAGRGGALRATLAATSSSIGCVGSAPSCLRITLQ